jgi:hypothetical protein
MRFSYGRDSRGSISAQGTDGLLEGRGRVFGDEVVLVIHLPRAIQELPDFYASFGVGSA